MVIWWDITFMDITLMLIEKTQLYGDILGSNQKPLVIEWDRKIYTDDIAMHEKIDAQQIQVTKNGDFTQTLHYEMVI